MRDPSKAYHEVVKMYIPGSLSVNPTRPASGDLLISDVSHQDGSKICFRRYSSTFDGLEMIAFSHSKLSNARVTGAASNYTTQDVKRLVPSYVSCPNRIHIAWRRTQSEESTNASTSRIHIYRWFSLHGGFLSFDPGIGQGSRLLRSTG